MNIENLSILILDDDAYLSDMYRMKFEQRGDTVTVMQNPTDALSFLDSHDHSFSVLLLDLVMPSMEGFDFLEEARKRGKLLDCKVIALTNQSREQDVSRARELGMHGYIVKASSIPSEVVDTVVSICASDSKDFISRL